MLQLVLDSRPHLHQRVPMLQQLPQIPLRQRRYPDPGKSPFLQQPQDVPSISLVGFLLPRVTHPYRQRIPNPQSKSQPIEHTFEPQRVPHALQPHQNFFPG